MPITLHSTKVEVLYTVTVAGRVLEHVSPVLQADRQVVMEAVQQDGKALQYASLGLQNPETGIKADIRSIIQRARSIRHTFRHTMIVGTVSKVSILHNLSKQREVFRTQFLWNIAEFAGIPYKGTTTLDMKLNY